MSDKNDENNPNCVDVVGAFHAEAGAEPLYAVKLDVVDGNYEDGAAFSSCQKSYHDILSIMYQQKSYFKLSNLTRLHFNFLS